MPFDVGLSHQLYKQPVPAVRGRARRGQASDLRARRRDAAPAAQPAGDGSGLGRRLPAARRGRRRRRIRLPRESNGSGATATSAPSVSPRSFAELRAAPRRRPATKLYLGLGENTPAGRRCDGDPGGGRPRLRAPAVVLGAADLGAGAADRAATSSSGSIPTACRSSPRDQFTDTGLEARDDLDEYRDRPFRDPRRGHGARAEMRGAAGAADQLRRPGLGRPADLPRDLRPRPRRRPGDPVGVRHRRRARARPRPSRPAWRRGGDVALDGLVRAFVGAGGRLVVASHWPVPDDFNATQRLITGLFSAPAGTSTVTRAEAVAAAADGRCQHVAPVLLVGVRGGRRRRGPGDPRRRSSRSPRPSRPGSDYWSFCGVWPAQRQVVTRAARGFLAGVAWACATSAGRRGSGRRRPSPPAAGRLAGAG